MNTARIQELKSGSIEKRNQGDVRIYRIADKPKADTETVKDPVLVYGDSGNHHKLEGGEFEIERDKESGVSLVLVKKAAELTHQQHKPPHVLEPGVYLIDRAREKGVFDDLVNPVQD